MLLRDLCRWRAFIFIVQFAWALFLWWLAIEKCVLFGTYSYVSHLTNIGWTLESLLFTVTLSFILPPTIALCNVNTAAACMAACFFPVWLLAWFIAATVFLLLIKDPEFITDLFDSMEPGLVIVGNDLFHVVPLIALIFLGAVHFALISLGINRFFVGARRTCGTCGAVAVFVYLAFGGALAIIGAYCALTYALGTSPQERYGTDLPYGVGIGYFFSVAVLFNVVPLTALACCCGICRPSPTPRYDVARAMSKMNAEIFGRRWSDVERVIATDVAPTAIAEQNEMDAAIEHLDAVASSRRAAPGLRWRF